MTKGPDHLLVLSTQFPASCLKFFCCGQGFLCLILEVIGSRPREWCKSLGTSTPA